MKHRLRLHFLRTRPARWTIRSIGVSVFAVAIVLWAIGQRYHQAYAELHLVSHQFKASMFRARWYIVTTGVDYFPSLWARGAISFRNGDPARIHVTGRWTVMPASPDAWLGPFSDHQLHARHIITAPCWAPILPAALIAAVAWWATRKEMAPTGGFEVAPTASSPADAPSPKPTPRIPTIRTRPCHVVSNAAKSGECS